MSIYGGNFRLNLLSLPTLFSSEGNADRASVKAKPSDQAWEQADWKLILPSGSTGFHDQCREWIDLEPGKGYRPWLTPISMTHSLINMSIPRHKNTHTCSPSFSLSPSLSLCLSLGLSVSLACGLSFSLSLSLSLSLSHTHACSYMCM